MRDNSQFGRDNFDDHCLENGEFFLASMLPGSHRGVKRKWIPLWIYLKSMHAIHIRSIEKIESKNIYSYFLFSFFPAPLPPLFL